MQLDGASRVLLISLFLMVDVSAEIVPPPTNLTLSCDHLNITARWNYQHPNTKFMVKIHDVPGSQETTDHHYDLSPFIWPPGKKSLGVHYVSITAIIGEKQSSPVQSESLTYDDLLLSNIKCKLAFPPVNLTAVDGVGEVTFRNPLDLYKDLWQAALFEFSIVTEYGLNITGNCPVHQKKCQERFSFPEGKSQCVTLRGRLCDAPDYHCVVLNETGPICPGESSSTSEPDELWVLFGVLFVISIIVIVLISWICLTKSWTFRKEVPIPPKLLQVQPHTNIRKPYFNPDKPDYSPVTLNDKICEISPVGSDEEDLQDRRDSRDGSGAKYPPGCYMEGKFLENSNQGLEQGYSSTDDSANDSLKTESVSIDLEDDRGVENQDLLSEGFLQKEPEEDVEDLVIEERSPYDCSHNPIEDFHRI